MVGEALNVPLGNPGRKEARTQKTLSESLGSVVTRCPLRVSQQVAQLAEESLRGGKVSVGDQHPKKLDSEQPVPRGGLIQVEVDDRQTAEELPEGFVGGFAGSVAPQMTGKVLDEEAHVLAGQAVLGNALEEVLRR